MAWTRRYWPRLMKRLRSSPSEEMLISDVYKTSLNSLPILPSLSQFGVNLFDYFFPDFLMPCCPPLNGPLPLAIALYAFASASARTRLFYAQTKPSKYKARVGKTHPLSFFPCAPFLHHQVPPSSPSLASYCEVGLCLQM